MGTLVHGARSVHAHGGTDRVCVARLVGDQDLFIYAGDGADRVLVQSKNRRASLYVSYGDGGGDVFRGGPADEWVVGASLGRASMRAGDDQLLVTDRKYRPDDAPGTYAPTARW